MAMPGASVLSRTAPATMPANAPTSPSPRPPSTHPSHFGNGLCTVATEFTGTSSEPPPSPSTATSTPYAPRTMNQSAAW